MARWSSLREMSNQITVRLRLTDKRNGMFRGPLFGPLRIRYIARVRMLFCKPSDLDYLSAPREPKVIAQGKAERRPGMISSLMFCLAMLASNRMMI